MRNIARSLSTLRHALNLFLLLALLALFAGSANAQQLAGHTPRQVTDGTAVYVSHYNPEQKLRLTLGVQPPDMAGEEALIREQQTKGSPNFHKFLTADEWNARFAPTAEDEQKVVDWAVSQGLTVTNRFANRLLVDVEAPAGVIESAFSVTINSYQVGEEVDFSIDRDPSIPGHLTGIVSCVLGLNSIQRAKPASQRAGSAQKGPDYMAGPAYATLRNSTGDGDPARAPWNKTDPQAHNQAHTNGTTAPGQAYDLAGTNFASPQDLFSSEAYNYNGLYAQGHCCNVHNDSTGSPADTSIALVTLGDFSQDDADTFFNYYGLAWNISAFIVDGTNTPGTECNRGAGGCTTPPGQDDEADLDVEISTAFSNSFGSSNNTAHVYVYEGANGLYSTIADIWNFVASDQHAHVVSTSYGWGEDTWDPESFITGTGAGQMHGIFNSLIGQGATLISAAGDHGPTQDCSNADVVLWPAADPDFLAAGGTSLKMNNDDTYSSEVAWTGGTTAKDCGSNGGGGGGGQSKYFNQPYWQSGLGGSGRKLPDISLEAGGPTAQWDYCTTAGCQADKVDGWGGWQGTSIVAPELAGFFAQSNAYLNSIGHICGSAGTSACEPIGDPGWIIYGEAMTDSAAHYPFYDIVKGCTTNYYTMAPNDAGYFCSVPGYDESTGWGSANMLQLAWAINWEVIPSSGNPYLTWSGPVKNTWYNTNQTVSWTVHDAVPANSTPGSGIAGETQGWDSIPADPHKEATPGSGNSFYSGPQFPNASTGCLSFVAGDCSGGVTQGCHTAYARGWNNQGTSTSGQAAYPETYGPICYDTVDPTITATLSPATPSSGWYTGAVKVTLNATDPGGANASGIISTGYTISGQNCGIALTCNAYTAPFSINTQGTSTVYYLTEDKATNLGSGMTVVKIDETAPVTTVSFAGTTDLTFYISNVTVTLNATDAASGVAATYYTLDGGSKTKYSGPIVVSTLGTHSLTYYSVDVAGNNEANNIGSQFVIYSPTTTSLSAPSTASSGQSVTLKATVMPTLAAPATGTVTFYNGMTVLGTATLSNGVATLSTSSLPVGTDSLTASFAFSNNYLGSTSSAVTTKVSSSITLSITPGSLTFASTPVGTATAAQLVTLTNIGTTPITFTAATTITGAGAASFTKAASTCTNPLASGASCTNSIVFKPTTSGALTATITYTDSGSPTPQTVTLTGTGNNSGPTLSISPGSLTFVSTPVGTATAAQLVTLTNTGTTPISFTAATTITGTGASSFSKVASTCTNPLAAGASCTNSIVFKPTASGTLTATITYTDSGSTTPQTVTLTGTGAATSSATLSISPGSLTFVSTPVGTATAAQLVTLTNTGTTPISFTAATTITGTGSTSFSKVASTCTNPLAAGASCTNSIVFKPTTTGTLTATITYTDSGSTTPQTVTLTGTGGAAATLSISPGSLTFASTAVGTATAAQLVTLTNIGTTPISFTAATTITGPGATSFTKAASTCTNPLAAGASCTNSIVFKPTVTGALSATITYTDSGSATPQTVTLTGTGQ